MDMQKRLFAFKLAEKQAMSANQNSGKWKVRDGVAVAGCTQPNPVSQAFFPGPGTTDNSMPC